MHQLAETPACWVLCSSPEIPIHESAEAQISGLGCVRPQGSQVALPGRFGLARGYVSSRMLWPQDWGFLLPQHRGPAVTTLTHGSCSPSPTPHPALVQIPEDTSLSYVFCYKHPKPIRHSTLKLINSRPFAFLASAHSGSL